METIRVPFREMEEKFQQILLKNNFSDERAAECARIFAENSLDGIYSHGVNRFSRFIDFVEKGLIKPNAEPKLSTSAGAIEQWNGKLGPGPLNAHFCTNRAMQLAEENGMGCVAVAYTNHWMRGGRYGWQAAQNGFAFIGWTNTEANMPAWGAKDVRLGNNPLVFAVPYGKEAIVLDFAMTQFSYGKLETYQMEGKPLSLPGGFDEKGNLSNSPDAILRSRRPLPIGYWKGSGLSLLLDLLAVILSAGLSTKQLSERDEEYGVSQVFIAFDLKKIDTCPSIGSKISEIIHHVKQSEPDENIDDIRYPGEGVLRVRKTNLEKGIPVHRGIWQDILNLRA
ncbi:MAG: 3-dehydro-L-gulonate 2-dehydrogenase [Spirochaetaceae bacterium]